MLIFYGIDFGAAPCTDYVDEIVNAVDSSVTAQLERNREMLQQMIDALANFELGEEDRRLGVLTGKSTVEALDDLLREDEDEWRMLRLLVKPDDEFWHWEQSDQMGGICMLRNGRVFKSWGAWFA